MPTYRLTLAKNATRTTQTVVVLNTALIPDVYAHILAIAKSKLRIRTKTIRFFALPTGQELADTAAILAALPTTTTILVSSGEPYAGTVAPAPALPTPLLNFATESFIDPLALTQLSTSATLPGIILAVAQPDLHPGTKSPIGAAFVSRGHLHPPLIGSDIGCGMSYYRVSLPPTALATQKACRRVADSLRGLEGPWRSARERREWVGPDGAIDGLAEVALGTVGAGNHFAEVQIMEDGSDDAEVALLVHSGSRGFGGDVLRRFYSPGTDEAGIDVAASPERAGEYLALHDRACVWARANRDLIALRMLRCLEGPEWEGGEEDGDVAALRKRVQERRWVDVCHNSVVRTMWPPGGKNDEMEEVFVHRKGAAPTSMEHPLLPLPGSRGTPTLLLRPLLTPENGFGAKHALSAAHGAGRAMSRSKAAEKFRGRYDEESGKKLPAAERRRRKGAGEDDDFTAGAGEREKKKAATAGEGEGGGWVVCEERELVWEEAPEAYKDVECVARDLVAAGVAEVVGRYFPRVTYKVRKE